MSEFKDIKDILTDQRLVGGALAGQGNTHPAGDDDEQIVHRPEILDRRLSWEIRNKTDHDEKYYYRDLYQFSMEVTGSPVEMHGINRIASPQGYPRSEDHSFDIQSKEGTTGDITDYEARLVKTTRGGDWSEKLPPDTRRDMNVDSLHNYVEPTGQ